MNPLLFVLYEHELVRSIGLICNPYKFQKEILLGIVGDC